MHRTRHRAHIWIALLPFHAGCVRIDGNDLMAGVTEPPEDGIGGACARSRNARHHDALAGEEVGYGLGNSWHIWHMTLLTTDERLAFNGWGRDRESATSSISAAARFMRLILG